LLAGATAWATLETDRGAWPAVVEAAAGRGKTVAITGGGMWRWWLDEDQAHHAFRQFWRDVVFGRLLGRGEVGERLQLTAESPEGGAIFVGRPVIVDASSRREMSWAPEAMSATIVGPLGGAADASTSVALTQHAHDGEHSWRGAWTPAVPGVYRILVPPMEPGDEAASCTIQVLDNDLELADVTPDVSVLHAIADPTGGVVMEAAGSEDWSERLINRVAMLRATSGGIDATRGSVAPVRPMWDRAWVMSFLLTLLLLEWSVRRWHGWR
jgi:hypothetical protein